MKQRIQDMNLTNKKVIVRCDFNVPIKNGQILDDKKIRASLETINYLINQNCRVILLSHLGKVKSAEDKLKNTLEPVAYRLNELLPTKVIFSKQTKSPTLDLRVQALKPKEVLLIENTRYEDFPEKLESNNDIRLASYWASLADVFVLDAFASAHRLHASTAGIAKFIPSCLGFLVQKELKMLDDYCLNPKHPFTIIMGGAKIDDKLDLMLKLLPKCDNLLLTGGLANSCLKALGLNIGSSLATNNQEILNRVREMLIKYRTKINLPLDAIVGVNYNDTYVAQKPINAITENESINDIGPNTINKYASIINESKEVFLNGTAGIYEDKRFANGTKELLQVLKYSSAEVIAGGGDCLSAINNFGYEDAFTYLSTGGGATLEYLVNEKLPAIDAIEEVPEEL